MNCEHKWVHLDTKCTTEDGGYNTHYKRMDLFFCEKCTEQKESRRDGYSRDTPEWWIRK